MSCSPYIYDISYVAFFASTWHLPKTYYRPLYVSLSFNFTARSNHSKNKEKKRQTYIL